MNFSQAIFNAVDLGDILVVIISVVLSIATYWLGRHHANKLFEREHYPDIQIVQLLEPKSGGICFHINLTLKNLSDTTSAKEIYTKIEIFRKRPLRIRSQKLFTYHENYRFTLNSGDSFQILTLRELQEKGCLELLLSEQFPSIIRRDQPSPPVFTILKKFKLIVRFTATFKPAIHDNKRTLKKIKQIALIPITDIEDHLTRWEGKLL